MGTLRKAAYQTVDHGFILVASPGDFSHLLGREQSVRNGWKADNA
jgi:hypothetical protein